MAFITDDDYSVLIRDEIKEVLLENYSVSKLRAAEQMAINQVKNYLAGKYDVTAIFEATGTDRNEHIVMTVIDCTLYHLYSGNNARRMTEIRATRYQDAIDWLKLVATGDATADLPKKKNEKGEILQGIKISSRNKPNNHKW